METCVGKTIVIRFMSSVMTYWYYYGKIRSYSDVVLGRLIYLLVNDRKLVSREI